MRIAQLTAVNFGWKALQSLGLGAKLQLTGGMVGKEIYPPGWNLMHSGAGGTGL